jgi:hypothetical protein
MLWIHLICFLNTSPSDLAIGGRSLFGSPQAKFCFVRDAPNTKDRCFFDTFEIKTVRSERTVLSAYSARYFRPALIRAACLTNFGNSLQGRSPTIYGGIRSTQGLSDGSRSVVSGKRILRLPFYNRRTLERGNHTDETPRNLSYCSETIFWEINLSGLRAKA